MIERYDKFADKINFSNYGTTKKEFEKDLYKIVGSNFYHMYEHGNKIALLKRLLDPLVDKYLPKEIWDALDESVRSKIKRSTFNTVYYKVRKEHKNRKNDVVDTIDSIIQNSDLTQYITDSKIINERFIPDFETIKMRYGKEYEGSTLNNFEDTLSHIDLHWKSMSKEIQKITYPAFYRAKRKELVNVLFREWLNQYDMDEINSLLAGVFKFKPKTQDPIKEFSQIISPNNHLLENNLRKVVAESADSTVPIAIKIEDLLGEDIS